VNPPEGAKEAVEELITSFDLVIDGWVKSAAGKSADFKRTAVLVALTNALVTESMRNSFSPDTVIQSVFAMLDATGAFDDDETVH